MAVLGTILTEPDKAIGEDALFTRLQDVCLLPSADDDSRRRGDGMSAWRTIISKEFVNAGYLLRAGRDANAEDVAAVRRAQAGISEKEDKWLYRIGPKARGILGTRTLLQFVCGISGVAIPVGPKLKAALGPEIAGIDYGAKKRSREERE